MQRLAAIALLALFACLTGASFAPALDNLDHVDALLPACCRAAGAHHCAMKDAPPNLRHASLTRTPCRAYPQHAPALLQPLATAIAPASLGLALRSGPFQTVAALESYAQARRTRSPRGPPSGTRPS